MESYPGTECCGRPSVVEGSDRPFESKTTLQATREKPDKDYGINQLI